MSTQLAISCPHCAATLKLKNNTFVGKKVPCPKCKKQFVVEQPPEDEFLANDDNDFGAMESEDGDAEEGFDAPPSKAKPKGDSKASKGKKKKSKSGGGFAPIAMIGGGVVLGLGLLGGLVYGAITMFGGSSDGAPAVAADQPPANAEAGDKPQQANDAAAEKAKFGDKAVDVLAYPGMVISAGEKSKSKANTLADKHNSDIEAAMQEGTPAATQPAAEVDPDAVPAANKAEMAKPGEETDPDAAPEKPARQLSKQERKRLEELEEQGLGDGNGAPAAPASSQEMKEEPAEGEENAAMESAEDEEEEAIPENDDDIPEGLAGLTMRLERQKAREAAAAKKASKASKKVDPDQGMDLKEAADGDADEMKAKTTPDADPDAATPGKSMQPKKSKKKSKDDDEEGDAPSSAESGGGPLMGFRLGGDPDAAPAMKSKNKDDEAEASDKAEPSDQTQKSRSRRRVPKKSDD